MDSKPNSVSVPIERKPEVRFAEARRAAVALTILRCPNHFGFHTGFTAEEAARMGHRQATARKRRLKRPKTVLRLLDLEHSKSAVLNSLGAVSSQESYGHAIDEFITWYCFEPRLSFSRTVVLRYRIHLEQRNLAQARTLLKEAFEDNLRGKRDRAMISILLGCGLRRAETVGLTTKDLQIREDHWVIADLIGKGKHIRTVPVPSWAKISIDEWITASGIA